jgi:hypothetical protein
MNYLVLHTTHGPGTLALIYEGNYSDVQAYLLEDRWCPPDHYRIVLVAADCGVEEEGYGERFFVRTSR